MHWPRDIRGAHTSAAADVMGAIIGAQLRALDTGDAPTLGDIARADPSVRGGDFY